MTTKALSYHHRGGDESLLGDTIPEHLRKITERFPAVRLAENLIAMQVLACLAWGAEMLEGGSIDGVLAENLEFFLRGAAVAKG